jgi:tetratricopeptide (TPR) repeat protein
MSSSERAAELADTATDRERYFILGSRHWFREEFEEAEANFRALLQIDPDHYWGLKNLSWVLQFARREGELVPLLQRRAEMAPNSFPANVAAATATLRFGSLEKAEPYFVRAAGLEPQDGAFPGDIGRVQSFLAHKAWLEEDIDGVLERVEEWARLRSSRPTELQEVLVVSAGFYSEYVGRLRAAEDIYRQIPDDDSRMREHRLRRLELDRGDQDHRKQILQRWPIDLPAGMGTEVWLHARAGLVEEARRILDSIPPDDAGVRTFGFPLRLLARGELALAEGRTEDAIPLLQEALPFFAPRANAQYFRASDSLARAWEQVGSVPNALRVLQEASLQKSRAIWGKVAWMELQLHLARLYRELGREADAREIEAELRRLLVHSDPDFWILRQLERQSRAAHAASAP